MLMKFEPQTFELDPIRHCCHRWLALFYKTPSCLHPLPKATIANEEKRDLKNTVL